jgi:CcmD family protein
LPFLFVIFSIIWITIFLYLRSIDRRSRRTERALADVAREIARSRSDARTARGPERAS